MKRLFIVITLALLVGGVAGCNPSDETSGNYKEGYFGDLDASSKIGFDFSEGVATNDTMKDMSVEPWVDDSGRPKPDFLLSTWGDSTKKIVDLGNMTLDDAVSLDPANLVVDTSEQFDRWDAYAYEGHSYYLTTREGYDVFVHLDSMKIVQDSNYWTSGYWIHYFIKE